MVVDITVMFLLFLLLACANYRSCYNVAVVAAVVVLVDLSKRVAINVTPTYYCY